MHSHDIKRGAIIELCVAGHSIPEVIRFAKHKDWSTNLIYINTMLAQTRPCVQALQAPLHLPTAPGRAMSMPYMPGLAGMLMSSEPPIVTN